LAMATSGSAATVVFPPLTMANDPRSVIST
jgi:hypothetical protein